MSRVLLTGIRINLLPSRLQLGRRAAAPLYSASFFLFHNARTPQKIGEVGDESATSASTTTSICTEACTHIRWNLDLNPRNSHSEQPIASKFVSVAVGMYCFRYCRTATASQHRTKEEKNDSETTKRAAGLGEKAERGAACVGPSMCSIAIAIAMPSGSKTGRERRMWIGSRERATKATGCAACERTIA